MASYFGILLRLLTEPIKFGAGDRQDGARSGRGGTLAPGAHDEDGGCQSQRECQEGHDPGHAVKTGGGGSSDHGRAIFLNKALENEVVVVSAIEGGHQFAAHAIRIGAAHVVALQKDLAAAAHAHHLVAKLPETSTVVSGAHERDEGNR